MTQYVRHFLEESLLASPVGWSLFEGGTGVVSFPQQTSPKYLGDRALQVPMTTGKKERKCIVLDAVTADAGRATAQVRFGFQTGPAALGTGALSGATACVRGSGTESAWTGYYFDLRFADARIAIVSAGIGSPTADVDLVSTPFVFAANTVYHVVIDATGTVLSMKVWADGTVEPAAYTITVVDSTLSAAGKVGIGTVSPVSGTATVVKFWYACFGTGGSAAPARPVSWAEYLDFLDTQDALRCGLAEISVLGQSSTGAAQQGLISLSNFPFTSYPADPVPNISYEELIPASGWPQVRRRLSSNFTGLMTMTYGDLVIRNETTNTDSAVLSEVFSGKLDSWLAYNWDGRPLRLLLGHPSWRRCDFKTYFSGTVDSIYEPARGQLAWKLRGLDALFQRPINTALIGGTGPNKSALMPVAFGGFFNATLPLYDSATLKYQFAQPNSGLLGATTINHHVRDKGTDLAHSGTITAVDAATDTLTLGAAAHGLVVGAEWHGSDPLPAPLNFFTKYIVKTVPTTTTVTLSATAGGATIDITTTTTGGVWHGYDYTTDDTTGIVTLLAPPSSVPTGDAGLEADGGAGYGLSVLISDFVIPYANIFGASSALLADKFHGSTLTQQVGVRLTSQETIGSLLNRLLASAGAAFCFAREGTYFLARLSTPTGTAAWSVVADDIKNWKTGVRQLPRYAERLGYQKNYTVQSPGDLVALSATLLDLYGKPYSLSSYAYTSTSSGIGPSESGLEQPANHLLVVTPEERETLLMMQDETHTELVRLYSLYRKQTGTYIFETDAWALAMELNDELSITFPRDGFAAGKNAILVGTTENALRGLVELEVFCQTDGAWPVIDSSGFAGPDYYDNVSYYVLAEDGTYVLAEDGTRVVKEI